MAAVSAGGGKKTSLFIQHDEHNSVFAQFPNIDIISVSGEMDICTDSSTRGRRVNMILCNLDETTLAEQHVLI